MFIYKLLESEKRMFERNRRHHPGDGGHHAHGHHAHGEEGFEAGTQNDGSMQEGSIQEASIQREGRGGPEGRGGRGGRSGAGRHGGPPGSHGGPGGSGGRARRGEARYVVLDAIRNGARHGYEIIKSLDERSNGRYAPSPGTVYPTLQYLEELGLIRAEQEGERRVYHLTETGAADLDTRKAELEMFWSRFADAACSTVGQTEIGFLQEELEHLRRTVWGGLRGALERDDTETVRRVRQAVEHCRSEVRSIVSEPGSSTAASKE